VTQIVEPEMATTVATAEPAGDNFQKEGAHRVGVGTFAIDKAENEAIYGAVVSP
jgi:hypothetical protein